MEKDSSHEQQIPSLENPLNELCERLGFVENDDLRAIRELAIEASTSNDTERLKALLLEYQLHGEALVNDLQGGEYMRSQIGLIVAKARLHRDTSNAELFLSSIKDAKEYAFEIYDDETVSVLEKVPSIEIARILAELGDEFGFDYETIVQIADEPYEQAFETAYRYLVQTGLDADEVLRAFVEQ